MRAGRKVCWGRGLRDKWGAELAAVRAARVFASRTRCKPGVRSKLAPTPSGKHTYEAAEAVSRGRCDNPRFGLLHVTSSEN